MWLSTDAGATKRKDAGCRGNGGMHIEHRTAQNGLDIFPSHSEGYLATTAQLPNCPGYPNFLQPALNPNQSLSIPKPLAKNPAEP